MSITENNEMVQRKQYLGFLLNEKDYGFPILDVDGIINIPEITPIPQTPVFLKGVINLRGKIIPVIDLRLILGMNESNVGQHSCIIVAKINLNHNEIFVGFIVDVVSEVFDIPVHDIEKLPNCGDSSNKEFITGIGKVKDKLVILLDLKEIISANETTDILNKCLNEIDKS